jgi:hypothetical protein
MARTTFPASFVAYRRAVDMAVQIKTGVSLDDLPDVCLIDWFEDRVPIATAARRAIRNARDF